MTDGICVFTIQIFKYNCLWKDSVPPKRSITITIGLHYCICSATKESLEALDLGHLEVDIRVYASWISLAASQERSLNIAWLQVCWKEIQVPAALEIVLTTSTFEAAWRQTSLVSFFASLCHDNSALSHWSFQCFLFSAFAYLGFSFQEISTTWGRWGLWAPVTLCRLQCMLCKLHREPVKIFVWYGRISVK